MVGIRLRGDGGAGGRSTVLGVQRRQFSGRAGAVDWQEEIYQKIRFLKECYFDELNELHQKMVLKFQQHEGLVLSAGQLEQLEKMKLMLERAISLLQINKNNIQFNLKEKIPLYEQQIMNFIAASRSRVVASQSRGHQQLQHPGGHAHSMTQQHPSQASQLQQYDNNVTQAQMSVRSSVASQSAPASIMQHESVSSMTHTSVSTTQTNMGNILQANWHLIHGTSFSSLQHGSVIGAMQQGGAGPLQNGIGGPEQTDIYTSLHAYASTDTAAAHTTSGTDAAAVSPTTAPASWIDAEEVTRGQN